MKKIYIASRFQFNKEGNLKNDFRSILLGSEEYLKNDCSKTIKILGDEYVYAGPFFNEKAAEHNMSVSFGEIVVKAEKKSIDNADVFLAIFDNEVSPGTSVELTYAIMTGKECMVIYLKDQNKSENWFPITFAEELGVKSISFDNGEKFNEDIISFLNEKR